MVKMREIFELMDLDDDNALCLPELQSGLLGLGVSRYYAGDSTVCYPRQKNNPDTVPQHATATGAIIIYSDSSIFIFFL